MDIDAVSFSEEVSQQGVLKPQYLSSQWETTEKFMGAEFLEQKHYSMYRRFMEYRPKVLWRARARRPDVWAKMSPFVSGVYTMLIL